MTKVFITKYCLSTSIFEIEAEILPQTSGSVYAYGAIPGGYRTAFFNNDFHLTKEEALADAKARRQKKIKSLQKQIEKLENLKIKIV